MKAFFGIILIIVACVWLVTRFVFVVQFDRNCQGHLKRAADANTIELAQQELTVAVNYMEKTGLTSGYTSIFYTTPDEDIGFWYKNAKASLTELESVSSDATQLEKTNVLMKLRETLLDDGDSSPNVTVPKGISIYPNNAQFLWWGVFSVLVGIIGLVMIAVELDSHI